MRWQSAVANSAEYEIIHLLVVGYGVTVTALLPFMRKVLPSSYVHFLDVETRYQGHNLF